MFFAIGFVLSVVVAFVSPYLFDALVEAPALPTAITVVLSWIVFAGGGYLLDRRKRRQTEIVEGERRA
ncbi:hypothetical protein [Microbacterium sp. MYb66]|uniref:hypothetical protein n=1 Tax=Microbacterium sp. MYb66 TaxID=1848692 RepID=UPI000D0043F8|nr:hypothetical protein [Microbacterium sp. MYb66]PRA81291.1 hypothetical protein CQ045_08680 [Microbacterium sp. MYb66]